LRADELQDNIVDTVTTYFEGDDPEKVAFGRLPVILSSKIELTLNGNNCVVRSMHSIIVAA
jgi:hypothetical protein